MNNRIVFTKILAVIVLLALIFACVGFVLTNSPAHALGNPVMSFLQENRVEGAGDCSADRHTGDIISKPDWYCESEPGTSLAAIPTVKVWTVQHTDTKTISVQISPTATTESSSTAIPTNTPVASPTAIVPTNTPVPPTATQEIPTETKVVVTPTNPPATSTVAPPTNTPVPPTQKATKTPKPPCGDDDHEDDDD